MKKMDIVECIYYIISVLSAVVGTLAFPETEMPHHSIISAIGFLLFAVFFGLALDRTKKRK